MTNIENCVRIVPLLFIISTHSAISSDGKPSASEILGKALQRAELSQKQRPQTLFTFDIERISETLDKEGNTKDKEHLVYQSTPIQGHAFETLKLKNGRSPNRKEIQAEEKRQRAFMRKLEKGEDPSEKGDVEVRFDKDLVSKYDFSLQRIEPISHGRRAFVLSFAPKSDDLPVRSRIDHALNKSVGELWVETETFELARVSFRLTKSVKLWWGLLGSISEATGLVERAETDEGIWMPNRFQIYLKGRILFASFHRRERIRWSNFRRDPPTRAVRSNLLF